MVSRLKQCIWKVLGCGWRIEFGKLKIEDEEMSRGCRRICTYFTIQGIHREIRSQEIATQGNPLKVLNQIYTSPPKDKKQRTRHNN